MKKWILLIWLFCVQLLAVHAENEYYTIFKVEVTSARLLR